MDMTLATRRESGCAVVEVAGEVDVYSAPALEDCISRAIDDGGADLIVDMSRVEFLDSTGLGVLVKALKRTRESGGSLRLVATDERVIKVFRITGLDAVIPIHESLTAATA